MKIYIDVLMITNGIITMLYISGLCRITHTRCKKGRMTAAAFVGAAASLLMIVPAGGFLRSLLIATAKLVLMILTVIAAMGFESLGTLLKRLAVYIVMNLLFGGCCLLLWETTGGRIIYIRNLTVYFDISLLALIAAAFMAYILVSVYEYICNVKFPKHKSYRASYRLGEYEISVSAVADSGNMLRDVFSGMPVVIFYCNELYEHFDLDYDDRYNLNGFRLIPCSTINGERLMPVTAKGEVIISDSENTEKTVECYVGVVRSENNKSRAIFNPCLLL